MEKENYVPTPQDVEKIKAMIDDILPYGFTCLSSSFWIDRRYEIAMEARRTEGHVDLIIRATIHKNHIMGGCQ